MSSSRPDAERRRADLTRRLLERLGERATDSPFERSFYTRDLAGLPGIVDRVFGTLPDLVVRPVDAEEVAELLRDAGRAGVAVTPRAGCTTALFGAVPIRRGIVLDLSGLRGVLHVDPEARTVRLRAGTVWLELERYLGRHGLAVKSMPSSATSSSVGGWVCTGGLGIGSLKYGPLISQVCSVQVVLPNGDIVQAGREGHPPLSWFEASEGTLGVVTEVELEVRDLLPLGHHLVEFESLPALGSLLQTVLAGDVVPYSIDWADRWTCGAQAALGLSFPEASGEGRVRVDYEGDSMQLQSGEVAVGAAVEGLPGCRLLPAEAAQEEWNERFRFLRIKRGGPSLLGAEVRLPLRRLVPYLEQVERLAARQRTRLMSYGHVVAAREVVVMTMFYADETRLIEYLLGFGTIKALHDLAAAQGGTPYGLGLWNAPHVRPDLSRPAVEELRKRKRTLDPAGVMNPGKGIVHPAVMNPTVVRAGMSGLGVVSRLADAVAVRRPFRGAVDPTTPDREGRGNG